MDGRLPADAALNQVTGVLSLCGAHCAAPSQRYTKVSERVPGRNAALGSYGDRYGAQAWVLQPHGGEAISLHYFWDSAVQRSQSMPEVIKTANQLRETYPHGSLDEMRARPYRGAVSYELWTLEESHRLAISAVYREGRLSGAAVRKNAQRLDEDYVTNARAIAARRMALSGHRLAEVLSHVLQ
jgi:hypothetical protein